MFEPRGGPERRLRTGHFIFQVRRKSGGAWDWQLRVEVAGTGQWGVFDSIQEVLRFMSEHMAVDEDWEAGAEELFGLPAACRLCIDGWGDESNLVN